MSYRRLFVFCEGNDDEAFVESILQPALEVHYDHVQRYKYAQRKPDKIEALIHGIQQIDRKPNQSADYLFLRDFDQDTSISDRKDRIQELYDEIQRNRIVLVAQMIEGGYAAGVSSETARALGVEEMRSTDDLLKPQFDAWMPDRFGGSRIDFMQEILKRFDCEAACNKNRSFDYFCTTFLP